MLFAPSPPPIRRSFRVVRGRVKGTPFLTEDFETDGDGDDDEGAEGPERDAAADTERRNTILLTVRHNDTPERHKERHKERHTL